MKFLCLGFADQERLNEMSPGEQEALIQECLAYDDLLRVQGIWGEGHALQGVNTAKTIRLATGKVTVTDGPYAETKEQLGGIGVLEARDMQEAVEVMSKHPGVRFGPWEIRPIDEAFEAYIHDQLELLAAKRQSSI
ncbi:MAG: YciI family protein [Gemmataceae bacterium]